MSQPEGFKSRIIDVAWSAPPTTPFHGHGNGNGNGNGHGSGHGNGHGSGHGNGHTTRLELQAPSHTEVITTLAVSSPVFVMEEVQLAADLDPRLIVLRDPRSPQARSFRLLQHRLFGRDDPRVIAVTSAAPGEGKTTCAANLALVLSEETFSRVLLIDANLQRPGLARLFRFEPADSLMTKLLRSEDAAAPYAVASITGSRLQLSALHPDVLPGKRLDRALLSAMLRALRDVFDYVIIDAASVLDSADANVACQCADAAILTARAGKSRKGSLRRAVDQLKPATVAGSVLLDT